MSLSGTTLVIFGQKLAGAIFIAATQKVFSKQLVDH